jgi:hypothetical protein
VKILYFGVPKNGANYVIGYRSALPPILKVFAFCSSTLSLTR